VGVIGKYKVRLTGRDIYLLKAAIGHALFHIEGKELMTTSQEQGLRILDSVLTHELELAK